MAMIIADAAPAITSATPSSDGFFFPSPVISRILGGSSQSSWCPLHISFPHKHNFTISRLGCFSFSVPKISFNSSSDLSQAVSAFILAEGPPVTSTSTDSLQTAFSNHRIILAPLQKYCTYYQEFTIIIIIMNS